MDQEVDGACLTPSRFVRMILPNVVFGLFDLARNPREKLVNAVILIGVRGDCDEDGRHARL